MSFAQIHSLLKVRARARGFDLEVQQLPWPRGGSLQKVGGTICVMIDSRRSPTDRLHALAHEAGHLLFGHYEIADEVWTLQEGPGGDEWEWEADFFAAFATRTPGTPADLFIGEQLGLKLRDPAPSTT